MGSRVNLWLDRRVVFLSLAMASCLEARAQERPFFITYNHHMEEPDSLEVAVNPVVGTQRSGGDFLGLWTEFEYGVKGWWTTEFYLDGQKTQHDGAIFTGFRWENRFRPLMGEHRINPVIYTEFESINEADKTLLEVVGHDVEADHAVPNSEARRIHKNEIETKLILSSSLEGWNISENVIAEKSLANAPWEFGYAIGVSRPLALAASTEPCSLCPENFTVGVEMFGGLGDGHALGFRDTSHYVAPVLSWDLPSGATLRVSPSFGLNGNSHRFLLRVGLSYEIPGFGRHLRHLMRGNGG
jgi:hypothetical protein